MLIIQCHEVEQSTSLDVHWDNEGVVEYQSQEDIKKGLKSHLAVDTDINLYIQSLLQDLNLEVTWKWVKGYQDDISRD